ncbi:MAG: AgmX/PglI C-terminal domain-containing protein [bacterium]
MLSSRLMVAALATWALWVPPAFAQDEGEVKSAGNPYTGRLPPEVIRRVVRTGKATYQSCYEAGLKKNPKLKGGFVVRFGIDTTGEVDFAVAEAVKLPDAGVVACVVAAMKTLKFPEPEGGSVQVNYPFDFEPPTPEPPPPPAPRPSAEEPPPPVEEPPPPAEEPPPPAEEPPADEAPAAPEEPGDE